MENMLVVCPVGEPPRNHVHRVACLFQRCPASRRLSRPGEMLDPQASPQVPNLDSGWSSTLN